MVVIGFLICGLRLMKMKAEGFMAAEKEDEVSAVLRI